MARIPESEVERLAEAQGIKLTRHGADLVGKCPFHDDRTPSLVITPGKNLWHCPTQMISPKHIQAENRQEKLDIASVSSISNLPQSSC